MVLLLYANTPTLSYTSRPLLLSSPHGRTQHTPAPSHPARHTTHRAAHTPPAVGRRCVSQSAAHAAALFGPPPFRTCSILAPSYSAVPHPSLPLPLPPHLAPVTREQRYAFHIQHSPPATPDHTRPPFCPPSHQGGHPPPRSPEATWFPSSLSSPTLARLAPLPRPFQQRAAEANEKGGASLATHHIQNTIRTHTTHATTHNRSYVIFQSKKDTLKLFKCQAAAPQWVKETAAFFTLPLLGTGGRFGTSIRIQLGSS